MRRALLICLVGLAFPIGTARAATLVVCSIAADPSPAWPGANVVVRGDRFPPDADITVSLGFFPVYDGFIADDGTFEISFRVPAPFELGPTELTVVDHTGECTTTVPLTIGPAPVPESSLATWGLALMAAVGVALGVGLAGVIVRRPEPPRA